MQLIQYRVVLVTVLGSLAACAPKDAARTGAADSATVAVDSAGARSAAAVPARRLTVLFVGTSLTAGLGLDPDEAYPALIQLKADSAHVPIDVVNAGLSGETSAGALRRIDWLLNGPADVVVIETGANDGLRGLDVDSTRANLQALVNKVKAAKPATRIALIQMEAPPNLGPRYTATFHAMYPTVAASSGATLLPFLLNGVAGKVELNQGDGIHPNLKGERMVASNVWTALQPLVNQGPDSSLRTPHVEARLRRASK